MIETQGKRTIIQDLSGIEKRTLLVGDGITDLEARDAVMLLVGFGGVVPRERVAREAAVFIAAPRLSALVPLALSKEDAEKLQNTEHALVLQRGLEDIAQGLVTFHDKLNR